MKQVRHYIISGVVVCSVLLFSFFTAKDYKKLHFDAIVIDAHNDAVQRMLAGEDLSKRTNHGHSDLPRFRDGGLDVEFFSIWVPPQKTNPSYYEQANIQIDSIDNFVKRNSSQVGMAKSTADIERLVKQGKFVVMLGLEGGHPLANDIKKLEHFYARGVRYITLTWNNSTDWASSSKDEDDTSRNPRQKGLSEFGKRIIRKMNKLGMIIDVSHVGERTFWDVIKTSKKPIIASHSSVWSLCKNRRNLKDEQIKAIAKSGGVVCINFNPSFIDSTFASKEEAMWKRNKKRIDAYQATLKSDDYLRNMATAEWLKDEYLPIRPPLSKLIDHIDYVTKLVGVEHVGIGSDFDGIDVTPKDMDDVTYLPNITRELSQRGYSDVDIKKILGGNTLRLLKTVEVN